MNSAAALLPWQCAQSGAQDAMRLWHRHEIACHDGDVVMVVTKTVVVVVTEVVVVVLLGLTMVILAQPMWWWRWL